MPPDNNVLPAREMQIFKKMMKLYESKQHKAALKLAKQILGTAKFAEHGETLCMKGLILNCMGKREEAMAEVKRGLRNNIKSHVCWHVYGLVQRAAGNNEDAIKAYRQALKIDAKDLQIWRDLALLQIQLRDLEGYCESRYEMLMLRPSQRVAWLGYTVARHMVEDYETAVRVLDQTMQQLPVEPKSAEHCELMLYKAMLLVEGGQLEEALQFLEENACLANDKITYHEIRARIFEQLERKDAACSVYKLLLQYNPENSAYYRAIERCLGFDIDTSSDKLSDDEYKRRMSIYEDVLAMHPRVDHPLIASLVVSRNNEFLDKIQPFLLDGIRKGAPATLKQLTSLYKNRKSAKTIIIENTLTNWRIQLESTGKLGDDEDSEPPTSLLWIYYFLAEHFDRMNDGENAIACIEKALTHTPTLIELPIAKAKYLRRMGAHAAAVKLLDIAQRNDTADRYINTKCAKYMLRRNMIPEAIEMCGKFTREGVQPEQNLSEMQCMWFETHAARAHRRLGNVGEALKLCHQVEQHFQHFFEDQADFHSYCMRKATVRSYIGLVRFEDMLREHKFFYVAAACAMKIYLRMHDSSRDYENADTRGTDSAEARKAARKARKQRAKEQERAEAEAKLAESKKQKAPKSDVEVYDSAQPTLDATQLANTSSPLDDAAVFARPILAYGSGDSKALLLAAEIYYRQGRMLAVARLLQAVVDMCAHAYENPRLHVLRVQLMLHRTGMDVQSTSTEGDSNNAFIANAIDNVLRRISPDATDAYTLNEIFIQHDSSKQSLEAHLAYIKASIIIKQRKAQQSTSVRSLWQTQLMPLMNKKRLEAFSDAHDYRVCKRAAKHVRQYCPEHYVEVLHTMHEMHPRADWFAEQLSKHKNEHNGSETVNGIVDGIAEVHVNKQNS